MDFFQSLFSKGTPVQDLIRSGVPQPVDTYKRDVEDEYEDAWEAAEVPAYEDQSLEEVWDKSQPQQQPLQLPQAPVLPPLEDFTQFWQEMCQLAEMKNPEYVIEPSNPFLSQQEVGLFDKAVDLSSRQDIRNAILALEAELLQNPENSDAWRMLGQLNAESEEDNRAIAAFKRGYETDPYNLDGLLQLGISLINEEHKEEAFIHLMSWARSHPEYQEIEEEDIKELFTKASIANPFDSDVMHVLGALHFLDGNYEDAVHCFNSAIEISPHDYLLYNRLGAALANSGENLRAIDVLNRAVQIRPCYARAWANLGISFANLGEMHQAAQFYMTALSINPCAIHIWNYLITAFVCLRRFDLVQKVRLFDVEVYSDEFVFAKREDSVQADWVDEFNY